MPRLRGPDNTIIDVDDRDVGFYSARGWTPETVETQLAGTQQTAAENVDTGLIGAIDAGVTSFASGATLGLTDVIGASLSTGNELETARRNREDNALISGVANFAGSLAPAFAAPGTLLARTPAGLIGGASLEAVNAGRAIGGLRGTAQVIGAGGAEGAISNAGSYLADVALADKDVSAEGLSAALGNGFKFGAAFSAGALGIEKGTIAARRLFAKPADALDDASAAATATGDWERKSQETLQANEAAAAAARRQLDEARAAREAADVARKQASVSIAERKAALARDYAEDGGRTGLPSWDDLPRNTLRGGKEVRGVSFEELSDRGWYELGDAANSKNFQNIVDSAKNDIAKGIYPRISASIAQDGSVLVNGVHDAALLRAARETQSPVEIGFQRSTVANDALDRLKNSSVRRGKEIDDAASAADAVRKKIIAGEVPGELGPFTDAGLEAAVERTLKRQASNTDKLETVVAEYDDAKRAFDEMKRALEIRDAGGVAPLTPQDLEISAQREIGRRATPTSAPLTADTGRVRVKSTPLQSTKTLEELLAETSAKLGEGATIADLNAAAKAPSKASLVEEIDEAAKVMTRYERAAAAVAEAVGDEAPAAAKLAAKSLREAEDTAERKLMESTTQALDDAAEMGPIAPSPRERLERARAARAEADVSYAQARSVEAEAAIGERQAREALRKTKDEIKASMPQAPVVDADPFGGFPDPSMIPVVGPLLSGYLKYRVAKSAAKGGRVPLTPKTKVAAFAAKAKSAIHSAVDKSLGIGTKAAAGAQRAAGAATVVASNISDALTSRAFDDGEPDAQAGATLQQKTAVRMREVAYAATNPQAVAQRVRRELRGVHDPEIVSATIAHQQAKYNHLNDTAPKRPPENPFARREWSPPAALAMQWGRRLEVADDPLAAFEALEKRCLTPEAAETLRVVYPALFAQAQSRMMALASNIKEPLPYRAMVQNSLLFNVPLSSSVEPGNMQILAGAHATTSGDATAPPPPAGAPPVPSIAGNTSLTAMFQTGLDRRAMR